MKNSKRIWVTFGSAAIVLAVGVFQSSVHAAPLNPAIGGMPMPSMGASAIVSPLAVSRQAMTNSRPVKFNTTVGNASNPMPSMDTLMRRLTIAAQFMLALYGLALIVAGRGGGGAKKSKANVAWGTLFIAISLAAPESLTWLMQSNIASPTVTTPVISPIHVSTCG